VDETPVAASEAPREQAAVPNLTKTDLLPPPLEPGQIPESGWTPTPAEVAKVTQVNERQTAEIEDRGTIDGDELLEDVEPDAVPIPPRVEKKPPPPPKKEERVATSTDPPTAPQKKVKGWFEDMFAEDYLRTIDELEPKHVKREVDFIEDSLGVEKQGVILDLACGTGMHTVELASRGYKVVGIDLSPTALSHAHEAARDKSAKPSFIHGDMRELTYEENFDGAYCWTTSFGYFDDVTNIAVLQKLHRALRKGGMLLLDVANRDYIAPRSPSLVWFEGAGCVCMDDMYVDFLTSRLRVKRTAMFDDGHSRELEYHIRLYTLSELGKLLHDVGFKVVEVSGHIAHPGVFFGTESPRLIILAERG
jgi:SAM-dependent methyltransferase